MYVVLHCREVKLDAWMSRWRCSVKTEDEISVAELTNRLKLNSMEEYLQNSSLQWFRYLERMKEGGWSSKCGTFKVSGSFSRRRPGKT